MKNMMKKKLKRRKIMKIEQCIKIIAEIVVNMSIVARIKFSCNLKNSSSAIAYFAYTHRWRSLAK